MTAIARDAFALDPKLVYLNHAAIGVLPRRAVTALHAYVQAHAERGVVGVAGYEIRLPQQRARLAKFLGAWAEGTAFVRNTSDACNILARGLALEPGDEILINDSEFGSNAYPWLALIENGVRVKMIRTAEERMTPQVLAREMTPRTRVVATSWVSFMDGYRHDLAGLAGVAHDGGALFAVDIIQGAGALPFDMRALQIDAVYGGGQKWLLAEPGLGFLCVTPELLDRLSVHLPGWRSVEDIWDFLRYDQPWIGDASRFEAGTLNLAGICALMETLDLLHEAELAKIAAHIATIVDYLHEGLARRRALVATPRGEHCESGIVTFSLPGTDSVALGSKLAAAGVVVTSRRNGIRVSPHGYATIADIDALFDVVDTAKIH